MKFRHISDREIRNLLALGTEDSPHGESAPADRSAPGTNPVEAPPAEPMLWGDSPGDRIGCYELVEPLGEGGFGQVWLARQTEPIRREVAVKRIKPGMDSREIISRFSAERQGLARMEHPGIAAFLDAGATADGRLYFAMERVKGPPLTDYCDERRLGIPERIGLFLQVCDAVQHAHRKAFIHRDLKPSNLLVAEIDGRAVPKVIDFGMAKALSVDDRDPEDKTLTRTQVGTIVGTPRYMSPEQARSQADIDTRSDVYSLGTVLHELLVGETPLSSETVSGLSSDEVLRNVREADSGRPSRRLRESTERIEEVAAARSLTSEKLERTLRGELDWILMQALEKDRERRYPSVEEFAADLRRHLRHEPVKAGPPSPWYRARKFVRRNRLLLGASAAVCLILALGLGLTAWQAVRATRAERIAKSRLEMAEQARDAAEALLSETVVGLRERLLPVGKSGLLSDSLSAAETYFEHLPAELANQQTAEHTIYFRFNSGILALIQGRLDEAQEKLESALAAMEALEAVAPLDEFLNKEATYTALMAAHVHVEADAFEEAAHFREIARRRCDAWIKEHPDSLWALACLSQEAGLAALEAALYTRDPPKTLPHIARLKYFEARLAKLDDTSPEYYQARGTRLFCEGFASSHLGVATERVVELFEAAAATFRLGYESDEQAPYRVVYRDMQLGAETAAGTRLIDLGLVTKDPEHFQRGRNLILDAYAARLDLAEWDPLRLEWWKDLAGSCKQIAKLARHTADEAEAERLAGMVLSTAPLIRERAGGHRMTAQTLAEALDDLLKWRLSQNAAWDADLLGAAVAAVELRSHAIGGARGGTAAFRTFSDALDLFEKGLQRAPEEAQRQALDELAALPPITEAAAGDPGQVERQLAERMMAVRRTKSAVRRHDDDGRADEAFRIEMARALGFAVDLSEKEGGPRFATLAALGFLAEDLRSWSRRRPSDRTADRSRAMETAIGVHLDHLENLAETWSPERIEVQLTPWATSSFRAQLTDPAEPVDAGTVARMIQAFRAAVALARAPDERERILESVYDQHYSFLLDCAQLLDAAGRDEEALGIHLEMIWVRESGIGRLSPWHYECLAFAHLHRALHFRELGRSKEAGISLGEAEKALAALSAKAPGSQRIRLYRHIALVLASSGAPVSVPAPSVAELIASQERALPDLRTGHDAALLDRAWGQLAANLPEPGAEAARAEWRRIRQISSKRVPSRLHGRLRPIPL